MIPSASAERPASGLDPEAGPSRVVLTFDLDWAEDELVEDALDLVDELGLKVTVFATHALSDRIRTRIRSAGHELGLHPHAPDGDDASLSAHLEELMDTYPDAVSVRSHRLRTSTPVFRAYREQGLRISSNLYLKRRAVAAPFAVQWNLLEVPIFEMDYFLLPEVEEALASPGEDLRLARPGVKVLCFHPVHLYLNTPHLPFYERVRASELDPAEMRRTRYDGYGIRTLFRELAARLARSDRTEVIRLRDLLDELP